MPSARPRLLAITWPIFSEQLLHMLMGLWGVWLVSRLSDGAVAAYALSNQIVLTCMITFRFVSIGATVVITQYLGAGDRQGADRVARAAIAANAWMGLLTCCLILLGATPLLQLMQLPTALLPEARPYLMMVGLQLLVEAINLSLGSVLRAHAHTSQTMLLIVTMYAAQFALSLPLMFGIAHWQGLGMVGLGLAAVLTRLLSLGLHLRLWRLKLGIRPRLAEFWQLRWHSIKEMLRIGLPGAGENVAYRISYMLILSMIASMGPAALSTHTYAIQVIQFVLLFGLSVGFGVEIVVGHHVGAGDLHGAHRAVMHGLRLGIAVSLAAALLAALLGPHVLPLFTQNAAIIATASHLLWFSLLVEAGRSFNLIVINGLRASGDARFPVGFGVLSMFMVAVGLAWLLGVHLGLGLVGIWLAYAADEWTRGLAMFARWRWHGWIKHARQTRRRLRLSRPAPAA